MAEQRHAGPRRKNIRIHKKPTADTLQEFRQWSELLSRRARQIEELLGALHSLSLSTQNKEHIKEIISLLAGLSKKLSSPGSSSGGSSTSNSASSPTGDLLYDLFTSPSMKSIVGEILKSRSKKRW